MKVFKFMPETDPKRPVVFAQPNMARVFEVRNVPPFASVTLGDCAFHTYIIPSGIAGVK